MIHSPKCDEVSTEELDSVVHQRLQSTDEFNSLLLRGARDSLFSQLVDLVLKRHGASGSKAGCQKGHGFPLLENPQKRCRKILRSDPGRVKRKEVEDYLHAKNAPFRQMCCVDVKKFSKGVYDDLTEIGGKTRHGFATKSRL